MARSRAAPSPTPSNGFQIGDVVKVSYNDQLEGIVKWVSSDGANVGLIWWDRVNHRPHITNDANLSLCVANRLERVPGRARLEIPAEVVDLEGFPVMSPTPRTWYGGMYDEDDEDDEDEDFDDDDDEDDEDAP